MVVMATARDAEVVGVSDHIRKAGLGDRERYPWFGKLPPMVEEIVIWLWCNPRLTIGEGVLILFVGISIGVWGT